MPHEAVISTIVAAIGLAFLFGAIANHIRLPAIVGYLLAGVVLGPFTPGIVADQNVARQLAEVGVILLLFGVGLHFSWQDLLSVRGVAIPGAIAQTAIVTLLGLALAQCARRVCNPLHLRPTALERGKSWARAFRRSGSSHSS